MIEASSLMSREAPWVHVLFGELEASHVMEMVKGVEGRVVLLDGSKMRDAQSLFREYVREFHFPEYFGWNWAAFHECMIGLENLPAPSYLTVVSHAEEVLSVNSEDDFGIYLRQLGAIGKSWAGAFGRGMEWGGGEVSFNTLFLSDSTDIRRFEFVG